MSERVQSGSQHFLGRIGYPLFLSNKNFDQKLPDTLTLVAFSMFSITIQFLNQSRDQQLIHVM